jgi:hypothetical protein
MSGAGAGVGGLVAARYAPGAKVISATSIPRPSPGPGQRRLAGVDPPRSGWPAAWTAAPTTVDLIVANPPYVAGESGRVYKDGGDLHGARLSLDWAIAGMERLWRPAAGFILYTGSAILDGGVDSPHERLEAEVRARGMRPALSGTRPRHLLRRTAPRAYADVERIAAVGAVITRPI